MTGSVRTFVFLAYGLTWVLLAPFFYVLGRVPEEAIPWWVWALAPLAFLGGWGPSVAALVLAARGEGKEGVRRLLRSLLQWRAPARWYLAALLLPPLATAVSISIVDRGFARLAHFDVVSVLSAMPMAYALALPFGPLGEELGWRGYALPRLLTRHGQVAASLILGVIWAFWHVPMMLWRPGASIPEFMGLSVFSVGIYLAQVTALTAFMTLLFFKTQGSVLLAVLSHLAFNTAETIVFSGLRSVEIASADERAIYLTNVAVLGALGVVSLAWLVTGARKAARVA